MMWTVPAASMTHDPVNRLVAAELEARWNAAMAQATEAETGFKTKPRGVPDENQRRRLMTLG
jgi:hypothetical protein